MACGKCQNDDVRNNLAEQLRGKISRDDLLEQNVNLRLAAIERAMSVHPVFLPINAESEIDILADGVKTIGKTDKTAWPVIVHGAISTLGLFEDLGGGDQAADTSLAFRLQVNDTGQTERTWATQPVEESLLTGQGRRWEGNNTIVNHFETVDYPIPTVVEAGNRLVLIGQNDGAATGYTRGYFTFNGMHVYEHNSNLGKPDRTIRERAEKYIRAYPRQQFIIIVLDVDFTKETKNLQFPTYYDDLIVYGFASNLWYSTFELTDPWDVRWTSSPAQIQALCSYAPAMPELSRFRKLIERQFLPRNTSYTMNIERQTAIGGAGPNQVVEDGNKIYMLATTI